MKLPKETVDLMAKVLERDERKRVFDELCRSLHYRGYRSRPRLAERIAMETGMYKTHVYRYLTGKMVPNPKTTARMIEALIHLGRFEEALRALEPAANRMQRNYRAFFKWKRYIEREFIYHPLSNKALKEAKTLLY